VDDLGVKQLRGIAASRGQHTGTVKLILTIDELEKIQEGDILVTKGTTPDFLLGFVRAGAIVTDRGGITSHAAILSRELNKPCVVGCARGTSVLRDGMTVTVDGSKGVVLLL